MKTHEFRIVLTVDNFDKALHFYRDTLGLESVTLFKTSETS
jgi:catechol 2,3-dioxygenase-like lactoylglutathione lyase family enzyme